MTLGEFKNILFPNKILLSVRRYLAKCRERKRKPKFSKPTDFYSKRSLASRLRPDVEKMMGDILLGEIEFQNKMQEMKRDLEGVPDFDFKAMLDLVDCGNYKYLDWV